MKRLLLTMAFFLIISGLSYGQIIITGIYDGDGSDPKGIELYVLTTGDYSGWFIKTQTNAATSWSTGYTIGDDSGDSGSYTAGDYIYISSTASTLSGWGWGIGGGSEKGLLINDSSFNQNGDDRIGVFNDSDVLIDLYGQDGQDGTGEAWEYTDSYSYRKDNVGASSTFNVSNWTVAGVNALESADPDQQTVLTNVFGNFSYVESNDPAISASSFNVDGFSYLEDAGPSSEQSITVSGSNLDGDISIAGTTNFEISTGTGGSFSPTNPITLSESSGSVAETNIYIRLKSGLTEATYNDTLVITSTNADTARIALEGTVSGPLSFPYSNAFGDTDDLDAAVALGFTIDYSAQTTYLRLASDEYIETPTIDFTEYTGLSVSYDLETFGGSTGQQFSTLVSDDNGATYDTLGTYDVPGSYTTFTTDIDLTGDYNVANGKIKMVMTSGSNSTRLRNLEINEIYTREITGDAGWRMLSFPISGGAVEDISDDTAIQGVSGGDNTGATSNFMTYDNTGAFETPASVSTNLGNGYGFIAYFYDNTDAGSSELPITLDAAGTEPSSDVSVDLNVSNTVSSSYYTMAGNPYASNFNLNSITATGGSIQNNVHFWDNGSDSYSALDRTTPYIVEPWQGFWVETTSSDVTAISMPKSGKTSSAATGTFFSKDNPNSGDINFTLSSETTFDKAIRLSTRPNAVLGYDVDDASKFTPLVNSYATMSFVGEIENEDKLQSVFSVPSNLEEEITIPLQVSAYNASGEFTFAWENVETVSENWDITLTDYETGNTVSLRDASSYTFTVNQQAQKSTRSVLAVATTMESNDGDSNRFGITITPSTSVGIDDEIDAPTEFTLGQNYPNPFNPTTNINYSVGEAGPVNITVYNVMGQKVAELLNTTKNAGSYQLTWNATGVASGIYYYRLTAPGQVLTRQMTLIK
ncbi:MAG: T9SS type A sorting domain-containing protein [Balneola sp.]